ncbi:MAG: SpoIID/LytB domain-containing protein, partial [Clostridia bacterium]|nr:SpoIID/LytB domain-containing protein [Clostridia bacterium]
MKENHQAVIRLVAMALLVCLLPWGVLAEAQVVSAPLSRASSARNGMVRVFLSSLGNPSALDITVQGSYTIGGDTSAPLTGGDKVRVNFSSSTGKLTLTRNGVTKDMGSTFTLTRHSTSSASGLLIAQSKNPSNPYPGDLKFKVEKNGSGYKLYTIASIYIETYLYGVLPYEMGNSAHIEALKAQAVAARTYTLDKMNRRSSSLYDVVDTTNDQVYRGTPTGNANCKAAVDATKGIVVMNGSGLTSTYYTASNGGQTESAANAWGSSSQYSYLKVKDDPFDLQASAAQKRSLTVYGSFSNASQHKGLKNLLTNKAQSKLSAMGYQSSGATVLKITNIVPHTPKYASPSRLYTMLDFYLTVQAKNSKGIWQNVSLTVTCNVFAELESLMGMSINSSKNELWSVSKSGDNFVLVS